MNLSNYASKADLKEATALEKSNLAAKSNFTSLKAEADKIDTNKLKKMLLLIWVGVVL